MTHRKYTKATTTMSTMRVTVSDRKIAMFITFCRYASSLRTSITKRKAIILQFSRTESVLIGCDVEHSLGSTVVVWMV